MLLLRRVAASRYIASHCFIKLLIEVTLYFYALHLVVWCGVVITVCIDRD